jgi:hypothetical protein
MNIRKIVGRLFLLLWVVPYSTFVYVFGTLNYPRYYLPVIPAIMILIIPSSLMAIREIVGKWRIRPGRGCMRSVLHASFSLVLILSFCANTSGLAFIIHNEFAPTRQNFNYVTSNYPPGTTIIEFHEHRVFQFYPNDMRYLHVIYDEKTVIEELSRFSAENTLLITSSAYKYLVARPAIVELHVAPVVEFFRDPHVKVEDHRILLYRVVGVKLR